MSIDWPTTINCEPLRGTFASQMRDGLARSSYDQGPTDSRKRFTQVMGEISFNLRLNADELGYLDEFYTLTLGQGTKWFRMRLAKGGGYVGYVVKFLAPYNANDADGFKDGMETITVKFSMEVRDFYARRGGGELALIAAWGDEAVMSLFGDIHEILTVDYPEACCF